MKGKKLDMYQKYKNWKQHKTPTINSLDIDNIPIDIGCKFLDFATYKNNELINGIFIPIEGLDISCV